MDLSQNMSIDDNDFEDNLEETEFQVDKEKHKSNVVTTKTEQKSKSTKKNSSSSAKKLKLTTKTVFLHQRVKSLIKTKVKRNKSKSEVSTPNSSKKIIKEEKTNKTYRKLKTFNLYHLDDILRGINRSELSETLLIDENIQGLILVVKGSNAKLKSTRSGITNMGYGLQVFAQKNKTCLPLYSVKGKVYIRATPLPYFGAKDKSISSRNIALNQLRQS